MAMLVQRRRLLLLTALAAALGLLGGGAAYLLLNLIGLITNIALFGEFAWEAPSFTQLVAGPRIIVSVLVGAVLVSLLAKWSPVIRGHGIPETMEAILTKQARIAPRTAVAKPLSGAIAIGTGGPFGAVGPIIVTGGSLGSLIGQVVPVSPSERKILLASGAAAGMAATFGTPIAAVVLAIELLLFEFSTRAFIPLVVASTVATGVHNLLIETGPLFDVPPHDFSGLAHLPLFAVLGLLCGLLAVVVSKGLFQVEKLYRALPVGEFWHPIIGALGFGVVGLFVPRALGVGYDVIGDALTGQVAVGTLAVLMIGKLIAWWIALGSGTSGGTLAPVLVVAATFGALVGSAFEALIPELALGAGAFAVVAMAATFGAATRATFASIIFVFEITRDYEIILPLMGASVIADLVAGAMLDESLMTEKLARRGIRVRGEYEVDVLRTVPITAIMSREVETLPMDATVGDVRSRFQTATHSAYPVVTDDGELTGIVARRDILGAEEDDAAAIDEVASADVVTVPDDAFAYTAMQSMLEGGFGHVPVLDRQQRLVGIVTRTDVVRTRMRQIELERLQPGWRPTRRAR